jgi:hypothetical protein
MSDDSWLLIDDTAKCGASFVVSNPDTGDTAAAYWHHDMWALYLPFSDATIQLEFEPTHYRPRWS